MSRLIWCYLLLFYIVIIAFHIYRVPKPYSPQWPLIEAPAEVIDLSHQPCASSDECLPQYACFQGSCIPKERLSGECNPITGQWVMIERGNRKYVTCVCKYPNIVTQKYVGGNCDTDVACTPKGHLKSFSVDPLREGECVCNTGYSAARDPTHGPSCKKMTIQEKFNTNYQRVCREDETTDYDHFSKRYFQQGLRSGNPCLKLPCTFDALSHKPLKHTKFDPNIGCVCDPRYGNVGVKLDHDDYLNNDIPGYNACVNIFKDEPDQPIDGVRLYSYFYLLDRPPVSFIQFKDLDVQMLKPLFEKTDRLQIEETFPYDYMQTVFKNREFDAHTRSCQAMDVLPMFLSGCRENEISKHPMVNCWQITEHATGLEKLSEQVHSHVNLYNILYKFPACTFHKDDYSVSPTYRGHHVLNPHHLTFTGPQLVLRSNGLVMTTKDGGGWLLDYAEDHNIRTYMAQLKHVPNLDDAVSQAVASGRIGVGGFRPRQKIKT